MVCIQNFGYEMDRGNQSMRMIMTSPLLAVLTANEKIIINVAAVVCILAFFLGRRMGSQQREDRRMDGFSPSQGISPHGISEEVQQLARSGKIIPAIKLHREQTHRSLAQAKNDGEAFLRGK
jgi:hypothetical protein